MDVAAGRVRLVRDPRPEAATDLGRAVPRPGGAPTRYTRSSRRCSSAASSTHTYANRAGKGTHRALTRYERLRDRHRYVLRGDIYPGDDLFTPFERRRGLPIGNLTSQLFANVYLDRFDHFVTEVLRAPYLRYVDDCAPRRRRREAAMVALAAAMLHEG